MVTETAGSRKFFKGGETILRQGDRPGSAFIIEEGRVEIIIERGGGYCHSVGTRGPGAMIGEMAMVDDAPRTATVRAVEDCKLLEITKEDFSRRLKAADPVLQMAIQVILTRYRDTLVRAQIFSESQHWPPAEAVELGYAERSDAMQAVMIANEFKAALDDGQVSLYYQPIIDLSLGHIVGFEALMRWEHPEKGFISPGVFIPVIEESGLILEASRFALRESCRALRRIEERTGNVGKLHMSVNFSSTDFASEDFVDNIYATISESDLKLAQLHIEITERLLMQQPDNARETLEMCRKAGMGISIDDFGTGYSSLSYLHYFPIDTLKIDQTFVRAMKQDEGSMELVRSIVTLAKNLKMKVVAEGVEEKQDAAILRDLGCDMAQGYYFARPLPEREVTALLGKWQPVRV